MMPNALPNRSCLSLAFFFLHLPGRKERVAFDKITARIIKLCYGLDMNFVDPVQVTQKVCRSQRLEGNASIYSGFLYAVTRSNQHADNEPSLRLCLGHLGRLPRCQHHRAR